MNALDYAIIVLYFVVVIGIGFWYQRRAARNLDSYFLGGKSMNWLMLSMAGAMSNYDISGTMWIVTLIALFGMKSMWNHWMWGFLMGAFFMAFMGKWVRRSGVMTGAEWMLTRFGNRRDGRAARTAYSLMAVVTLTAFTGYAFQGIGKFTAVYIPTGLPPQAAANVCAVGIFVLTTLYVLLGGLYSVVVTNVVQTAILTAASVVIAAVAYMAVSPELLAQKLPEGWASLAFPWRLENTAALAGTGYAGYELFGALVVVWVIKGLLLNLGGPGQMYDFQLFLATRDAREAAKVGAAWSGFLVVRWAMAMGIALLAVIGTENVSDPERMMPIVLHQYLPMGFRGLVIAGLFAAFMSTFSATVNSAASYLVRDWWQPLSGAGADSKSLIWASYASTLFVVLAGTVIGLSVPSVGRIFSWIMMELGAAFVIPNVLRWFWWRLNGSGYAIGTLAGLLAAIAVPFLPTEQPLFVTFPTICAVSLIGCLVGTWLTRPTDPEVLVTFYRTVRPFGAWGPVRAQSGFSTDQLNAPSESPTLALLNVLLGGTAVLGAYLAPMYLVGHWHVRAIAWSGVTALSAVVLYFTWYRTLPETERETRSDDWEQAEPAR
ncbi:MAG: hypothetical protein HUU20_15440 [Pirellulales bacterium]|nr:hypothetical protein [Pirellulales bacterium]